MKFLKVRWLVAGALASGLILTGCSASNSNVRVSPYTDNTGMGFGHISKTKQSDDNLWMPLEDPLRTRQQENVLAAQSDIMLEDNNQAEGTGGSGQCIQPLAPSSAQ
jgi:hypothetical protein